MTSQHQELMNIILSCHLYLYDIKGHKCSSTFDADRTLHVNISA